MPPIFRKFIGEKNDQEHYQYIPDYHCGSKYTILYT